jgi:hypothetical protein
MPNEPAKERSLVFSYLGLRKIIGVLGTTFPFLLFFGALILFDTGLRDSMSGYYHTGMRNVFVGTLCVIGFFLLSYRGYERADDIAGDLACLFAVGTALFPTAPADPTPGEDSVGKIHFISAALLFLTLAYFCLRLFTKTDPSKPPTRRKRHRNRVYRTCGYIMLACVVLIFIYMVPMKGADSPLQAYRPVYWLEAVAVVAFGISWLTKGEAILKDEG